MNIGKNKSKPKVTYCSRCKTVDGPFINYSRTGGHSYYHCRKCNTERLRKYRATEKGAERTRQAVYRAWKREPEKQAARLLLNAAVKDGRMIRPTNCPKCDKRCVVQAHHTDYARPLKVKWLCRQCHADVHRERNEV
jgi:transposase-like protein